jgi:hypothetical protein
MLTNLMTIDLFATPMASLQGAWPVSAIAEYTRDNVSSEGATPSVSAQQTSLDLTALPSEGVGVIEIIIGMVLLSAIIYLIYVRKRATEKEEKEERIRIINDYIQTYQKKLSNTTMDASHIIKKIDLLQQVPSKDKNRLHTMRVTLEEIERDYSVLMLKEQEHIAHEKAERKRMEDVRQFRETTEREIRESTVPNALDAYRRRLAYASTTYDNLQAKYGDDIWNDNHTSVIRDITDSIRSAERQHNKSIEQLERDNHNHAYISHQSALRSLNEANNNLTVVEKREDEYKRIINQINTSHETLSKKVRDLGTYIEKNNVNSEVVADEVEGLITEIDTYLAYVSSENASKRHIEYHTLLNNFNNVMNRYTRVFNLCEGIVLEREKKRQDVVRSKRNSGIQNNKDFRGIISHSSGKNWDYLYAMDDIGSVNRYAASSYDSSDSTSYDSSDDSSCDSSSDSDSGSSDCD